MTLKVTVNGEERLLPAGSVVADVLAATGLRPGVPAAVELNGIVVPKAETAVRGLAEGDRLEIVVLVGGG
jgi:sulfur carrier protein